MASAEEVQGWFDAFQLYEAGVVADAILKFKTLSPNARIIFNIGCCFRSMGDNVQAIQKFQDAIHIDVHFALPHYLLGGIHYEHQQYETALECYGTAFKKLRGNKYVDYRPLGLNFHLYASEILANQGILSYKLHQLDSKLYFTRASKSAVEKRHEQLHEILNELKDGKSARIFTMPEGKLFQPSQSNICNIKKKDYLGHAKVISTNNDKEIYSRFSGIKKTVGSASPKPSKPDSKVSKSVTTNKPPKPPPPATIKPYRLVKSNKPNIPVKPKDSQWKPIVPSRPLLPARPLSVKQRADEHQGDAPTKANIYGNSNLLTVKREITKGVMINAVKPPMRIPLNISKPLRSPKPVRPDNDDNKHETRVLKKSVLHSYSISAPRKRLIPGFNENALECMNTERSGTFPQPSRPRKPLPIFDNG